MQTSRAGDRAIEVFYHQTQVVLASYQEPSKAPRTHPPNHDRHRHLMKGYGYVFASSQYLSPPPPSFLLALVRLISIQGGKFPPCCFVSIKR